MDQYIVDVEINIMDDALGRYNDLIDNGYDDKFKVYTDDYFKCEKTKWRTCCSSCNFATFLDSCDKLSGCKKRPLNA